MRGRVAHWLSLAVFLAAALSLAGCGEDTSGREGAFPDGDRGGAIASLTSRSGASEAGNGGKDRPSPRPPREPSRSEDLPPQSAAEPQEPERNVLVFVTDPTISDEALQDPDPTVRIQALEAWVQQPDASLNPVTYALVDPDPAVRARAQELFEQELERR
jgi:hypothetical protein